MTKGENVSFTTVYSIHQPTSSLAALEEKPTGFTFAVTATPMEASHGKPAATSRQSEEIIFGRGYEEFELTPSAKSAIFKMACVTRPTP